MLNLEILKGEYLMVKELKAFLFRGNIIELAVAVIIGELLVLLSLLL